jgi:hypothetical protein
LEAFGLFDDLVVFLCFRDHCDGELEV